MAESLIEPARIKAIQESLCGFLLDEVINPKGEFYSDQEVNVAIANQARGGDDGGDED